eukprot:363192-Chlamydomonas_euryale.AAC.23
MRAGMVIVWGAALMQACMVIVWGADASMHGHCAARECMHAWSSCGPLMQACMQGTAFLCRAAASAVSVVKCEERSLRLDGDDDVAVAVAGKIAPLQGCVLSAADVRALYTHVLTRGGDPPAGIGTFVNFFRKLKEDPSSAKARLVAARIMLIVTAQLVFILGTSVLQSTSSVVESWDVGVGGALDEHWSVSARRMTKKVLRRLVGHTGLGLWVGEESGTPARPAGASYLGCMFVGCVCVRGGRFF